MSDKRYLGNIITQNPTAPAGNFGNSAAKGVWSLEEQLAYQKAGLWPVPGNLPLNVEEVFSTYLYSGNGSTRTITNGIDLDGEGGLVWIKNRGNTTTHNLHDTERGAGTYLQSNASSAEVTDNDEVTAFNSNGFSLGDGTKSNSVDGSDYASWTFRKAKKFFDVVTYTGNGTAGRTISHNLGSVPGMIIVKQYQAGEARPWSIYHRGIDSSAPEDYRISFTTAARVDDAGQWNDTAPTSSVFTVGDSTYVNNNGESYVAYLFAHNSNDGTFGPDGDADAIKCGSYTGNGSATGPSVDLGFEPQWLLIRNVDRADDWVLIDAMRGIPSSSDGPAVLRPESSAAEYASGSTFSQASRVDLTATGFDVKSNNSRVNGSSQNMIYIAIRRGTAVPTSATEVFAISQQLNTSGGTPSYNSGFPVDMAINKYTTGTDAGTADRLRGAKDLLPSNTIAEYANSVKTFDYMDGYYSPGAGANSNNYSWMWKRAPNYMDVVAYTGNYTARTINHNLGAVPEMIWVKSRSNTRPWIVYHSATGNDRFTMLNATDAQSSSGETVWNQTTPTSSVFSIGAQNGVNQNSQDFIAYLFATLAGISKVGSVTHSGTTNVDCGFSSGARFILLKRTDATGDWYFWDSARGIVSGNDPYLLLNSTAAQVTNTDYIDPLSSGFTITSSFTAGDYIFYAIA